MADTSVADTTVNSTGGGQVVVRQSFVQGHDNPFKDDGELSHKADYILRHSTISRTEIRIVDPDSPTPAVEEAVEETVAATEESGLQSAPPPQPEANGSKSRENGQVEDSVKPKDVNVEMDNKGEKPVDGAPDTPAKSKEAKKKCQCCVVM